MNQPLSKLQKEASLLKLSTTEKAALHAALMQKMGMGDASAPRMTPSPFFFAPQFAMSFAAFLLLVLAGGTAFAAKGALPGDPLYTVKTQVNEPIEGALSFSVESKIKFHSDVAQARLEEAEVLASQNRLDSSTTQELESQIDAHLSQRDELAAALDQETPGASSVSVGISDSSIAAHGEVLAVLADESKSTTTRDNSASLASRVRVATASRTGAPATMMFAMAAKTAAPTAPAGRAPVPMAMTLSLDASNSEATSAAPDASSTDVHNQQENAPAKESVSSASTLNDEKTALSLEKRATSSLESLKRSVDETRGKVKESVAQKLDVRLSKISALVAQGEASVVDKDFEAAKDSFSQALDKSATLSTFISANARFDSGLLGNLLNNNPEEGDEAGE